MSGYAHVLNPEPPGSMYVPIAQVMPLHIKRLGRESTVLVKNQQFARDMARFWDGQRSAKPQGFFTMPSADGTTPMVVAALGQVEVSELEDIVLANYERDAENVKKYGSAIDFASERERRGFRPKDEFDTHIREMWQARIDQARRNPRSAKYTPMKVMGHTRGQSMISIPNTEWKNRQREAFRARVEAQGPIRNGYEDD